jgi:hypothetical protein
MWRESFNKFVNWQRAIDGVRRALWTTRSFAIAASATDPGGRGAD